MTLAPILAALVPRWMPWWVFAPAVAIAVVSAVAFYSRDRGLVPRGRGRVLTTLRALLLVALLVLLLDLASVRTVAKTELGQVLVAVDASLSMALTDAHRPAGAKAAEAASLGVSTAELDGMPRFERVRRALGSGWLRELAQRHRPVLVTLDGEARPISPDQLATLRPEGVSSDLGAPLLEAALRAEPGSVSGIVLLSDGNHHGARDPRAAARALGALGVPIVAVGAGAESRPRDVSVSDVDAAVRVFAGDEVDVEVAIDHPGMGSRTLPLSIRSGDEEIGAATLELSPGDGPTRFPVRFPSGSPGRRRVTLALPVSEGEASAENNRRDFWTEVLSGEVKLLYLEGTPRWEYVYLRNAWRREKKVIADVHLVAAPPQRRLPSGFPRTREALFSHDVVVLGDVDRALFTSDEASWLADFVTARGGTLVLVAGERAMPYSWAGTPLEPLLPVELFAQQPAPDLAVRIARAGLPYVITASGEVSPILRLLAGRARNLELWELVARPEWFVPVRGARPGGETLVSVRLPPGSGVAAATILPEDVPVIVTRGAGAGKVFYAGIDATWRWRRHFGDELQGRFWGQVLRWAVAERLEVRDEYVRLGSDRVVYEVPAAVRIEALVETAPGVPLTDGLVDAVISAADGGVKRSRRLTLTPVPRSSGRYRGVLSSEELAALLPPGEENERELYECRVELELGGIPGYASVPDRAALAIAIARPPRPERLDLSLNRTLLEELAALSGGAYVPLAELRSAASWLRDRTRTVEIDEETAVVDSPIAVAVLLFGLLAAEWVLRKRWRLV